MINPSQLIGGSRRALSRALRVARGEAPKVHLFYWSPNASHENFGDHLSAVLIQKILERNGCSLDDTIPRYKVWETPERLLGVGSILHFARTGDVVWGSGINGKETKKAHTFHNLDVRLLRGPLTHKYLRENFDIDAPRIYGDPALLAGELLRDDIRTRPGDTPEYIFIPNLNDTELFDAENTILPSSDWEDICSAIAETELVLSSSLHGIVVAEAFGTPARLVRSRAEPMFKYRDYYLGTGRDQVRAADSIPEALDMGGRALPVFSEKQILETFPLDLWRP